MKAEDSTLSVASEASQTLTEDDHGNSVQTYESEESTPLQNDSSSDPIN
jgi:hypothetical protein